MYGVNVFDTYIIVNVLPKYRMVYILKQTEITKGHIFGYQY